LQIFDMIYPFILGGLTSLLHFWGLWYTLERLRKVHRPSVWLIAGFLTRVSVTATIFYLIMDGDWKRLGFAMLGFIIARHALTRYLGGVSVKGRRAAGTETAG